MPEVDAKLIFARHAERTLRIFGQEIEALLLCEEEHQHAVYENHLVFAFRPLYCQDALLYSEFVLVGISIPADAVFPTTKHGILAFGQILRDVHQDVLAFVETIRSGMNHSLPFLNERPSLLHRATSASDRDVGLWPMFVLTFFNFSDFWLIVGKF